MACTEVRKIVESLESELILFLYFSSQLSPHPSSASDTGMESPAKIPVKKYRKIELKGKRLWSQAFNSGNSSSRDSPLGSPQDSTNSSHFATGSPITSSEETSQDVPQGFKITVVSKPSEQLLENNDLDSNRVRAWVEKSKGETSYEIVTVCEAEPLMNKNENKDALDDVTTDDEAVAEETRKTHSSKKSSIRVEHSSQFESSYNGSQEGMTEKEILLHREEMFKSKVVTTANKMWALTNISVRVDKADVSVTFQSKSDGTNALKAKVKCIKCLKWIVITCSAYDASSLSSYRRHIASVHLHQSKTKVMTKNHSPETKQTTIRNFFHGKSSSTNNSQKKVQVKSQVQNSFYERAEEREVVEAVEYSDEQVETKVLELSGGETCDGNLERAERMKGK